MTTLTQEEIENFPRSNRPSPYELSPFADMVSFLIRKTINEYEEKFKDWPIDHIKLDKAMHLALNPRGKQIYYHYNTKTYNVQIDNTIQGCEIVLQNIVWR